MSPLLKRELLDFSTTEKGTYLLKPATIEGLSLSGGGAKGIAYIGMLQGLFKDKRLEKITHISGASAGAMTASLLALGISQHTMETVIEKMSILNLLDNKGQIRARGDRFRNMLDIIYMFQLKKLLEETIIRTESNAEEYDYFYGKVKIQEQAMALAGMKSPKGINIQISEDIISLSESPAKLPIIDHMMAHLESMAELKTGKYELPSLTFADLPRLRKLLPANQQHLIKNLSVAITNQGSKKLEIYNEDETPEMAIAQAVQLSGAHPFIFQPGKNKKGQKLADGGIIDNLPEITALPPEKVLYVQLIPQENFSSKTQKIYDKTPARASIVESTIDLLTKFSLGGAVKSANIAILNRQKQTLHTGNLLLLNTGKINTMDLSAPSAHKQEAIEYSYIQTDAFFLSQGKTFSSPLAAFIYFDMQGLSATMQRLEDSTKEYLTPFEDAARLIYQYQEHIVQLLQTKKPEINQIIPKLFSEMIAILQGGIPMQAEQEQATMLCFQQIDHVTQGKLTEWAKKFNAPQASRATPASSRPSFFSNSERGSEQSTKEDSLNQENSTNRSSDFEP